MLTHEPHILVVDDDPALLQALPDAIRLQFKDAIVDTARSAHEGLAHLRRTDYDVVVTDLVMPGESGLWLMDEILALHLTPAVILMTAHLNPEGYSFHGEAFTFVRKPIERHEFIRTLRSAIYYGQARSQIEARKTRIARTQANLEQVVKLRKDIEALQDHIHAILAPRAKAST